MPPSPSPCLLPADLARWARGEAPPERVAGWSAHVQTCSLCRAIAQGLGAGTAGPAATLPPPTSRAGAPPAAAPKAPRSLWWVPWVTHALLALVVGLLGWWFLGRSAR
jgi:hypothetical protein